MAKKKKREERAPELLQDNQARLDELGSDPGQVGAASGGQSGGAQGLSQLEDVNEESVEELAEADQSYEASVIEGVEDAADHPERSLRPREKARKSDDFPSREKDEVA
jgi:hypothetical protein